MERFYAAAVKYVTDMAAAYVPGATVLAVGYGPEKVVTVNVRHATLEVTPRPVPNTGTVRYDMREVVTGETTKVWRTSASGVAGYLSRM